MNNDIKLSIYIPTYNRLKYLKRQVEFMLAEIEPFQNIELIISNNNSTDGTADYLLELENNINIDKVRISSNDKNVGVIRNIEKSIDLSKGDFIWIVGDDDKLKSGVVKSIMDTINNSTSGLTWIVLNFEKNGIGLPKGATHYNYNCNSGFDLFKQVITTDRLTPMFITANVIKRKHAIDALSIVGRGNYAIPLAFSLCSAINGNGRIISKSYLVANNDNISWKDEARFIYCNEIPNIIINFKGRINKNDYNFLIKTILNLEIGIGTFFLDLMKGKIKLNPVIQENMKIRPIYTLFNMLFIPIKKIIYKIRGR